MISDEKNLTVCEDIHVDDIGNEDKALDIIIPDLNTSMLMVIMIIYLVNYIIYILKLIN
jgi:hypothetical protein